jgi:hypothetical protein
LLLWTSTATARVSWFAATVTTTSFRVACTAAIRTLSGPGAPVVAGVVVVVGAVVVVVPVLDVVLVPVVEVDVVLPVTVSVPFISEGWASQ